MKHVVMYSGGVGSWCAAKRVVDQYGAADAVLLFADTGIEDEDLHRFLDESSANLGVPLVKIADGRTPWEVFRQRRFIGNTRADPCSEALKRIPLRRYITKNFDPADTAICLGIDWSEEHRAAGAQKRWLPWLARFPLCEQPYLTKEQMIAMLNDAGIRPPRLYEMGFPHNNCGGFCVKAGQSHFRHLLKMMPDRYRHHEQEEQRFMREVGKNNTILRDRRGGKTKPLSLSVLRENCEQVDEFDWGGCGCLA